VECRVGDVAVHYVEHGYGRPVLVLHGAGVDHREAEACFEPALRAYGGLRRLFPDLPGMGRTPAPSTVRSADDVLDLLIGFAEEVGGGEPVLLIGHSAGGYFAHGLAARRPDLVAGMALVCPLLADLGNVPDQLPVTVADNLGDEEFRSYFVVQTPEMLQRYERFVAPALPLVDQAAAERIGDRWELTLGEDSAYDGPTLIVAGRQDSTVGYAAAVDQFRSHPLATLAVLDGAGHALPHEQPSALAALVEQWLSRVP
jgi:pimeloyl-ACP methyl ester carboxylesterase